MYVLATMNTADQNVFTLDTAFQRRWNMRQIKDFFVRGYYKEQEVLYKVAIQNYLNKTISLQKTHKKSSINIWSHLGITSRENIVIIKL